MTTAPVRDRGKSAEKTVFDWRDPLLPRGSPGRGGAPRPRQRARLRAAEAHAAHQGCIPRGTHRPRAPARDGTARVPGRDDRGLWLRRRELCLLWARRARAGAGRQRLSLDALGAVVIGDAPDPRLRHRGAAPEIPAEARHWRARRLLRPDRARPRLGCRRHEEPRQEGRWRLRAERQQDVDQQFADRRRHGGVGEGRRGPGARLHPRARHEGPDDAEDRGQVLAARVPHRRDRDAGRVRAGSGPAAGRQGIARARSHASTTRATASPGARSARPSSAGRRRATTRSRAPPSASRSRPTSSSRRSSPTCRPRSRSASMPASGSGA